MLRVTVRVLTMAGAIAAAVLMAPAWSVGCPFCWHHTAAPVVAAPACTTCAPTTVGYMPTSIYRALYAPAVVTPVAPCSTCASYAVTTYRPWYGGWTNYSARLVPYTTYQPIYSAYQPVYAAMPVAACSGCSTCASCSPCSSCSSCVSYSPCASCNTCASGVPSVGCSSCSGGGCGAISYAAPTPPCASCAAPVMAAPVVAAPMAPAPMVAAPVAAPPAAAVPMTAAPAPILSGPPALPAQAPAPQNAAPPQTFQEKTQKPATDQDVKPIPHPDTQLNSMPAPLLSDPRDRTAALPDYSSARIHLVASPVLAAPPQDNDGWVPARN